MQMDSIQASRDEGELNSQGDSLEKEHYEDI